MGSAGQQQNQQRSEWRRLLHRRVASWRSPDRGDTLRRRPPHRPRWRRSECHRHVNLTKSAGNESVSTTVFASSREVEAGARGVQNALSGPRGSVSPNRSTCLTTRAVHRGSRLNAMRDSAKRRSFSEKRLALAGSSANARSKAPPPRPPRDQNGINVDSPRHGLTVSSLTGRATRSVRRPLRPQGGALSPAARLKVEAFPSILAYDWARCGESTCATERARRNTVRGRLARVRDADGVGGGRTLE